MNGHLRARMKNILRQCEAPIKIYNSKGFPASNYRVKWSNIAGQGSNMKKMFKKSIFLIFLGDFSIDPGGPGGHPGGSRTDSRAEKHQEQVILEKKSNTYLYKYTAKIRNVFARPPPPSPF